MDDLTENEAAIWTACPACGRAWPFEYDADDWHGCHYCNDEPLGSPERCNGSSVCVAAAHLEGCYADRPKAWAL